MKRPGREIHSTPSSAEDKEAWTYNANPILCLHATDSVDCQPYFVNVLVQPVPSHFGLSPAAARECQLRVIRRRHTRYILPFRLFLCK